MEAHLIQQVTAAMRAIRSSTRSQKLRFHLTTWRMPLPRSVLFLKPYSPFGPAAARQLGPVRTADLWSARSYRSQLPSGGSAIGTGTNELTINPPFSNT